MNKFLVALSISVLSLGFAVGDAEAKRLGGGKSSGVQRESVTQKQAAPAQHQAAAPASAPAAAPTAAPKRNWMGPLAGLAAGLGIAALLSHFGLGEGVANFLMIALLVMAAIFVVRLLFKRKVQATPASPLQYAGVGNPGMAPLPQPQSVPGGGVAGGSTVPPVAAEALRRIPADFDSEGFLRVAKLNFIRLQASNDARNLDDIREFVSSELYAEIKMQMDERGSAAQHTDVVTLNAELLEVVSEAQQHVASVRFYGMIREEAGAAAAPFDEVWNLTKQVDGNKGWTVAGIQQLN